MRLCEIHEGRPGAGLVSCLTLSLWISVVSAAETPVPETSRESRSDPIEEIEVTGRATRLQLRAEIEHAEIQMFGLFNQLNEEREFDVTCQPVMVTGSRIAERECVPIYMKRVRLNAAQKFLFTDLTPPPQDSIQTGSGVSIDRGGLPETEAQLWFQNNPKHMEFNAKFRELAAQHPELAAAALDWKAKQQRLAELEESRR